MNKKQLEMFYAYATAIRKGKTTLLDYYTKPSKTKHSKYANIRLECVTLNGFGLSVCSANTYKFSIGYIRITSSNEIMMIYHTKEHAYSFMVDFENFTLFPEYYRKWLETTTRKKFRI